MLPLVDAVKDLPWRMVFLDLPWAEAVVDTSTPTSAGEVADGVLAEIEDHLGDEPFAVIGNSFGGMIARHVAHERRNRVLGVATLAGVVEPARADRSVPERTVLHTEPAVLLAAGDAREAFEEVSVIQDAAAFEAFEQYVLPGLRGSDAAVMEHIAASYALDVVPEERHPAPFTAPALHLFGRQDDVVGYEDGLRLRDHYPRGSFVILDAAGHNVHLEQSEVTAALVRDRLARIDR